MCSSSNNLLVEHIPNVRCLLQYAHCITHIAEVAKRSRVCLHYTKRHQQQAPIRACHSRQSRLMAFTHALESAAAAARAKCVRRWLCRDSVRTVCACATRYLEQNDVSAGDTRHSRTPRYISLDRVANCWVMTRFRPKCRQAKARGLRETGKSCYKL